MICSNGDDSASTTIVMQLKRSSSVALTASDMMLNPRRENRPATRESTPALFSTTTVRMWCWFMFMRLRPPALDPDRATRSSSSPRLRSAPSSGPRLVGRGPEDDLVVRRARGDHRIHLLAVVGAEVD